MNEKASLTENLCTDLSVEVLLSTTCRSDSKKQSSLKMNQGLGRDKLKMAHKKDTLYLRQPEKCEFKENCCCHWPSPEHCHQHLGRTVGSRKPPSLLVAMLWQL